jgi:transcriptional regulator with XRE-family HTH domain
MNYEKIKTLSKKQKIKVKELAKTVDVSEVGLYQMIRNQSMKVETLEKISSALRVSPVVFFDGNEDTELVSSENIAVMERCSYLQKIVDLQSETIRLLREQLDTCRGLK